jgi:ATP/ADP translocase
MQFLDCSETNVPKGDDFWATFLYWLMGIVGASGVMTMAIYRWTCKYVLTDKLFYDKPELPGVKKAKTVFCRA